MKTKHKNKLFCSHKQKCAGIRSEMLDQDYLKKLTKEEKDWLMRFNEEYVGANFNHSGKRIHPKKTTTKTVKKTGETRKVDIYKKSCEDANNARNRDSYGKAKVVDKLTFKIPNEYYNTPTENPEDYLIDMIDANNELMNSGGNKSK